MLVLMALVLPVLLGMTALAVDVGGYATERRDLQNAADSIALAAAQELPDQAAAQAKANAWAAKNGVATSEMTVTITQQSLPSVPNPKVRVEINRNHEFAFARVLGVNSTNNGAAATSIKTSPGASAGLVPWSVTQPILNLVPPGEITTLKYDSNNVTSGNFGAVRIDGSGASTYRDTVEYGSTNSLCATGVTGCPYPGIVTAETGNMAGPTRTAVNYLLNNTSTACDTWTEVTLTANGTTTLNPACNPFLSGGNTVSRIIVIPVVANLCNGACDYTITEFALFFLEGYTRGGCTGSSCNIQGRFINSNINYNAQVGVYNASTLSHFVKLTE